jgi:hypothetical protein
MANPFGPTFARETGVVVQSSSLIQGDNMKRALFLIAVCLLLAVPSMAADTNSVSGIYVEARTAEVFTGGCLMSSEAETTGRQAVLAWRVDRGSFNNAVSLDGLTIIAVVVGDKNLGIHELGGAKPVSRTALFVDDRASAAQRAALLGMAKKLSGDLMGTIVSVQSAPIHFADEGHEIAVTAPKIALNVGKHAEHNAGCGAEQWFHPLASVTDPTIGMTNENSFSGSELGSRWSDPDKVSAFFGKFVY